MIPIWQEDWHAMVSHRLYLMLKGAVNQLISGKDVLLKLFLFKVVANPANLVRASSTVVRIPTDADLEAAVTSQGPMLLNFLMYLSS